ncbi:RNA polymerase sigma factor RpoD/SigA [Anaerosalibacter bizertensis]|uniref:RNA polymerase sigma factor RpoD/SigA n=1 Tax=Anaerosalibacter bizertensis TaxID=932217 RepID=A0A9Q4AAS3_9FIRM|nr:RNA polymerase sigma factor RpoD/SigA [Anaerosalibacter bizertensis]MBV1819692.1 RNA polymerase sigma factor RpoD/SigA [Bacteroidales bacterium MSK.15.36]HHV25790.1 sigma-70 family RNA polymerase sigma factor [Tissierellia bacterium]MCB5558734.1 RNA polymerase sigma factor RpoD/SigA [Anaerosalibacter bizertensis]MCG4564108.1 RNA polymerase sigma factor RpoD/SigA [Anaerosalibacter bizertensis]MCG4582351.1 RNA polymerase sigma factor RpoD/SigA [Anaerosalibacter bizertensis]
MKSISAYSKKNLKEGKNNTPSNRELLISYKVHKNMNARDELILNNMGLVYMVAKKRMNIPSSFVFEDLVQEGTIGMMKGIEKFDINRSTSFSTYIYYWIIQQIDRALINNGHLIRLPAYIWEKINKLNSIENSFDYLDTDLDTLCSEIKITEDEYNEINYYRKKHYSFTSLNTLITIDNDTSYIELQDLIPDNNYSLEETIVFKDLEENLDKILSTLSPREKEILELRFGLRDNKPNTLQEIGDKYNLTRERIRQIESKALKKIRKTNYKTSIKEYLSYP